MSTSSSAVAPDGASPKFTPPQSLQASVCLATGAAGRPSIAKVQCSSSDCPSISTSRPWMQTPSVSPAGRRPLCVTVARRVVFCVQVACSPPNPRPRLPPACEMRDSLMVLDPLRNLRSPSLSISLPILCLAPSAVFRGGLECGGMVVLEFKCCLHPNLLLG